MALITVSGEPGCRPDEVARLTAQLLNFELVTESRLQSLLVQEFGSDTPIPDKAYSSVVVSIIARLATELHLVLSISGAERLFKNFPGVLSVQMVAPESRRVGTLMLERRLDRPAAKQLLRELEKQHRADLNRKFGRATTPAHLFDIVLNTASLEPEHMAELIGAAARLKGLVEQGLLSAAAEAQVQFQVRLQLAKHKFAPPGKVNLKRAVFVHPSEEIFANLLDFYRIAWEYEPRSFPIQWDKDGNVLESFTPDFYLPEFDLFVELTTMKQSLVTRKNRKVKLLKAIYPHVNIQVFYQKDIQNLILKYGLADRLTQV
jgi:cytidylate kinase